MKVVYYTRVPTGEVIDYYKLTAKFNESDVQTKLAKFNKEYNETCNATIVEIEEGTLCALLIAKAENKLLAGLNAAAKTFHITG